METELKGDTRRRILQYLFRHGAASRQALAAALGVSMPTVLSHVQALVGQGLAAEDGQYDSTGGRRAAVITGVPSARLALGVDVTGRDLGLAVADLAGRLLFHRRAALRYRNEPAYYEALGALTREFWADSAGSAALPLGVGVSIAGILSPDGARITTSHTLNVQNVDCGLFRAVLPGDCLFINDANAAGLAEMSELGGARSMVYLSLSGSVGGAVFMQGKLALGANQRCGEVGHLRLLPGRRCYCGQDGCADAYCNAGVLSALSGGRLDLFFAGLAGGNPVYRAAWDEYLDALALLIVNLRMVLDCDVVAGGAVGAYLSPYLPELRARVTALDPFRDSASCVTACRFQWEASAYGAAMQHVRRFLGEA